MESDLVGVLGRSVWSPFLKHFVYMIGYIDGYCVGVASCFLGRFVSIGLGSGYSIYTPFRFEANLVCCVLDGSSCTLPVSQVSNPSMYVLCFVMLVGLVL